MATQSASEKEELERAILENGGSVVQNPGQTTYCVLADKISLKVDSRYAAGFDSVIEKFKR